MYRVHDNQKTINKEGHNSLCPPLQDNYKQKAKITIKLFTIYYVYAMFLNIFSFLIYNHIIIKIIKHEERLKWNTKIL